MISRSLALALVVTAAAAAPGAADAQSHRTGARGGATSSPGSTTTNPLFAGEPLRLDALLGFEFVDGNTGFRLRVDGETGIKKLAPNLRLSGVLSLGFSHFSDDQSALGLSVDATSNVFDLIPAARFTFDLAPRFSVYGDAGLGLYYISTSVKTTFPPPYGSSPASDSAFGVTVRLAPGAYYAIDDRMRIGAELGLNLHLGDWDQHSVTLLGAFSYRI